MAQDVTPEQFAQQLGGKVSSPTTDVSVTLVGKSSTPPQPKPPEPDADPDAFAKKLGGSVDPRIQGNDLEPNAVVQSGDAWPTFWRGLYAAVPQVTGMIGGAMGATVGAPAGPAGAATGSLAGAGAGGVVGRGIQQGIDVLLNRPAALQNPNSYGQEATQQMTFEGLGRAFGGLVDRFKGRLDPTLISPDVSERLATNRKYGLRMTPGEITQQPGLQRTQYLAQRGLTGYSIQKNAQVKGEQAAQNAVSSILDTLGKPGTATSIGAETQDAVKAAAERGVRRVSGAVSTNLAPRTGMGTTGEITEAGVQAGRTAFARQGDLFHKLVADAPPVDVTPLQQEAWRVFNDEIMPRLEQNPALAPKGPEWQRVVRLYRQASQNGGVLQMSDATRKALADAALDKAPYGPLRVINQIVSTPGTISFDSALALRGALRDAGKGTDLLAGDAAQSLATYMETGGRLADEKGFGGLRGLMNDTFPLYEQAAEAYRTNRQLFESNLVEKVASSNPESVLQTLTSGEGKFNASRIRSLKRVLIDLPQQYPGDKDPQAAIEAGKKAWDTVRAEWFRRDVLQDNVFGLSDRLKKVDPDVLRSWFPDLAGKNVLAHAEVTGKAFESHLLANLADADPSKVVDMIGSTPAHVAEFQQRINALPGPVQKDVIINRVRRAWTENTLASGDPAKIVDRINKTDPELLKAWFKTPDQQAALDGLRRIGNAMATKRQVQGMGAYESLGAITIGANLLRGNWEGALVSALGFEGIPGFVSWAMYNPKVQDYLFQSAAPTATITSRTAALLRAVNAWKQAEPSKQPQPAQ